MYGAILSVLMLYRLVVWMRKRTAAKPRPAVATALT
jgi:hypothetical protein